MNGKHLIGISAGVLLGLILLVFFLDGSGGHFVLSTIDYVIQNLASRSGLSPFLVRGTVILGTIPFFWAIAMYTHGLFWLHGVKPSLRLYRSPYGMIIVGYVGIFFIAMYFASRDAYAYKWCADTPEGIRAFDGPGTDPVYGLSLKPCAFDQIVKLRQAEKGFKGPQRIAINDARQFEFFDPITGKPRVWYNKHPDGRFDFFDQPGKYPGTGEDLIPMDRETSQDVIRIQESDEALRRKGESEARQHDAARLAADQQQEKQAFVEKYINTAIVKRPSQPQAAILVLEEGRDSLSGVENNLYLALSQEGFVPVRSFFKPPFILEGRGRRLYDGEWSDVSQFQVKNRVDYIVLANAKTNFSSSSEFEGLITAYLNIELKCLETTTETGCGSQEISASGAGYAKETAVQNAIEKARPEFQSFAKTIKGR